MSRRATVFLTIAAAIGLAGGMRAYLKLGGQSSTGIVGLKWTTPIRYSVTNRDVPSVTAVDLANAAGRAFSTWAATPGVSFASQFLGLTNAEPITGDNATVIGFQQHDELNRTLGLTTFGTDVVTGQLLEADIFLNSSFAWSVSEAGTPYRYDVQSIISHEVGHLLGVGHSALGETELTPVGRRVIAKQAIMFPIAFPPGTTIDRTLKADDAAAISDIYATADQRRTFGEASGHVTLNGAGLFGAHVIAANIKTGALTGGFALDQQGTFVINGLAPGLYLLRAEPLDDADVTSFFSADTVVNVNFQITYATRLVSVPAGGAGASVEIQVQPK